MSLTEIGQKLFNIFPSPKSLISKIINSHIQSAKDISELLNENASWPNEQETKSRKSGIGTLVNANEGNEKFISKTNISRNFSQKKLKTVSKKLTNENVSCKYDFKLHNYYEKKVKKAVQERKVFVVNGNYRTIRTALKNRGWIEKLGYDRLKHLTAISEMDLLKHVKAGNNYETVLMSKMLQSNPAYFIWQPKNHKSQYDHVTPYRNRIYRDRRFDFTKKDGLMKCVENYHWHHQDEVTDILTPKYHKLDAANIPDFLKTFRLTQCLSVLQFFNDNYSNCDKIYSNNFVKAENSLLGDDFIYFAIDTLQEEIKSQIEIEDCESNSNIDRNSNNNINSNLKDIKNLDSVRWDKFVKNCNDLISGTKQITKELEKNKSALKHKIEQIFLTAKEYWPTMRMDGYNNLWILKPAAYCRGIGIVILKNCSSILEKAKKNPKMNYIAQKYIEKPLLIYKTKFDIRQHILLTIDRSDINIWVYKTCYLRFSSREYSLSNLSEVVHLTNNSVQKKYKNGKRSELLPNNNMWTLKQFEEYLKSNNKANLWSNKIYPKIKSYIIAVVLGSLEETEFKTNSFELYGCDFMLDEEFNPILIEINSTPDMSPSTTVTAHLCPLVLKDVIKVVLDLPKNQRASTGNFELAYRIPITKTCQNNFNICGHKMILHDPTKIPKSFEAIITNVSCEDSVNLDNSINQKNTANSVVISESIISESIVNSGVSNETFIPNNEIKNKNISEGFELEKNLIYPALQSSNENSQIENENENQNTQQIKSNKKFKRKSNSRQRNKNKNVQTIENDSPFKKTSSAMDIVEKSVQVLRDLSINSENSSVRKRIRNLVNSLLEKRMNCVKSSSMMKFTLPSDLKQALALKYNAGVPKNSNDFILNEFLSILSLKN